ncbi:MAG: cytochrome c4 [Proteobacteria bacterium]|nr:cytochrome c4 [Pseudomonadota bacterium]
MSVLFTIKLHALPATQQCAACHGEKGISSNPLWPNLAGQGNKYLLKQLNDFKKNEQRQSPLMNGSLSSLSQEDLIELSNFYAKLPLNIGKMKETYLVKGQNLYRSGDRRKGITACVACHGPKGKGNVDAGFPVLSGQQADYTIAQLKLFKTKQRTNDLNAVMQNISAKMSIEDMQALAYYIEGLH